MRPAQDIPKPDVFLKDAASILATAERSPGETPYTLLLQPGGGLYMIAGSDWPLDTLAAHHGAERAYRITHTADRVSVEGRSGTRSCHLATEPPAAIARRLLAAPALYSLIEA